MKWVIRIDADLPSMNTWLSKHWRERSTGKADIAWMVIAAKPDGLDEPIQAQVDIRITAWNQKHIRDADNLPDKAIIDGLRYAKILKEDTGAFVRWVCRRLDKDGGKPFVMVEIEEVGGE